MIRAARLADRQALTELSRRIRSAPDADRRSLGLPGPSPRAAGVSLSVLLPSWMPLRATSVHLVLEEDGVIVGSCRALEEPRRDDWVVVELDAGEHPMAAEVRYELLEALLAEGGQRNVQRYHAACSDARENLELFTQLGFMPYAEEEILYRPPAATAAGPGSRSWLGRAGTLVAAAKPRNGGPLTRETHGRFDAELSPYQPSDAWHLYHLWAKVTPPAVARAEGYRASDWESADREAVVPRSSLTPLLRFGDVRSWLVRDELGACAFVQYGASREGPHYLRWLAGDGVDTRALLDAGLAATGDGPLAAGVLTAVRTYEAHLMRAAIDAGFEPIGRVTLLVREVRAAVRQPAMVPAVQ